MEDLLPRNNPSLSLRFAKWRKEFAARETYHIPKGNVPSIETKIQDGDVICITGKGPEGFTEHVGLAYRDSGGTLCFMHASKDERRVIIDVPLRHYLYRYNRFAGIMVARPLPVVPARYAFEERPTF